MLSQTVIDSISKRQAMIECFDITLTQNASNSPLIFSGPGCLYFEDSSLKLKQYSNSTTSQSTEIFTFFCSGNIGVVPESKYFTLEARDVSGKIWKNNRTLVQQGVNVTPTGTVLTLSLDSVTSQSQLDHSIEGGAALIIVNGTYQLPFNEYIDTGKGSRKLSKLVLSQERRTIEITQEEERLLIKITDPENIVELSSLFYILEGISIAIGQLLEASFLATRNGGAYEAYIQGSVSKSAYTLADPIVEIFPSKEAGLNSFLKMYLNARPKDLNHMVNYWQRLKDISSANTEAAALVLCVNIEGMVKNYFSENIDLDEGTLEEIRQTQKFIKSSKSEIPAQGVSAILGFLGNIKTKTVSNVLTEMGTSGSVDPTHVKSWKDLRNTLAHADNSAVSSENFGKFVADLQNCLALFARLIDLCVAHRSEELFAVVDGVENIDTDDQII